MADERKRRRDDRTQSSVEYILVYAVAFLIIAIAVGVLLINFPNSSSVTPNMCMFSSGANCVDMVLGINSVTSNSVIVLYLANSESYAIADPSIRANISNSISNQVACYPNYVKPGGAIVCNINLATKSKAHQFISGSFYLSAHDCEVGAGSSTCNAMAPNETYQGSFSGYTQPAIGVSFGISLSISGSNAILFANDQKDKLTATVTINGHVIPGATVNFTANAIGYSIAPQYSNTNESGDVASYIWSQKPGNVIVYANFSGVSSNVVVTFLSISSPGSTIVPFSGLCGGLPTKTITVTDANYSTVNPISYTGASKLLINKLTSNTITITGTGSSFSNCFDIYSPDGGKIDFVHTGSGSAQSVYIQGNASLFESSTGSGNEFTASEIGNGKSNLSISNTGSSDSFNWTGGDGNLNFSSSNTGSGDVFNLENGQGTSNMVITGSSSIFNLTTAPTSTVKFGSVTGSSNKFNLVNGSITFTSITGSTDHFNITDANVLISSLVGSSDTFNFYNDVVSITSCTGSDDVVHSFGNTVVLSNPCH